MKTFNSLVLASAVAIMATGCSSMSKDVSATAEASLYAPTGQVITRPSEFAYKILGTAIGEADYIKVFGITEEGDKVASVPGFIGASPMENLAAYRAVEKLGGDAFFKLSTVEEKFGLFPFYSEHNLKVTGKVLKIVDLGTIEADRADKRDVLKSAKGSGENGFFGSLFK